MEHFHGIYPWLPLAHFKYYFYVFISSLGIRATSLLICILLFVFVIVTINTINLYPDNGALHLLFQDDQIRTVL